MDLILINGKVYTMDPSKPAAEAVAVENGRLVKVGSNEDVLSLKTDDTRVIDLEGKPLLPGFNDSHMHLLSFGSSLRMVDLNCCKSIEDIIEKTKEFIKSRSIKKGTWVQGRGWNHDYFISDKRFPTRYDLDKISGEYPIALSRACGHICSVNSKALEMIGVTKDTPQVEGGRFDLDENGEPLGIFREKALSLVYDRIPQPDIAEIKSILKEAAAYANSKGLTSVQTDDFEHVPSHNFKMVIKAYEEIRNEGDMTLRVYEQCLLSKIEILKEFLGQGYGTGYGDDYFKLGPLKLLSDGSLGARTAALCRPYSDDPSTSGILVYSQEQLDELVSTAHNAGMHVAIHCIGDKAMYMAFNAIEKALRENPRENHRHSIVHCQITDETLLRKFKELNVIAHVQPIFLHYDLHMVEDRIGKERTAKTYAFKTMLDSGVHIGIGTDCPVEALDVMPSIYCAVNRKDLNGYPEGGWLPNEKISVEEAVYSYTMGSAYASFEENNKGSITEGKLADMVVLNSDIFEIAPDMIKDVEVDMTFVGGRIVYSRD